MDREYKMQNKCAEDVMCINILALNALSTKAQMWESISSSPNKANDYNLIAWFKWL